jgi:hypothetical protein
MYTVPTADALVDYIKDFTGSTNTAEIKQCIFLAELSMRNIELPALRSDPYDPQYIGVVDSEGGIPIPGDMNKPILFFKHEIISMFSREYNMLHFKHIFLIWIKYSVKKYMTARS